MPNFDFPPDGSIQLGQIITSHKTLSDPLAPPLHPRPIIQTSHKTDCRHEDKISSRISFGLWLQSLAGVLGAGADVTASWERKNESLLFFRQLDTEFIQPDNDYVRRSILGEGRERVTEYLRQNPRHPLFMITGLKIARGARGVKKIVRQAGFDASVGVSASSVTGLPVQTGPRGSWERRNEEISSWEGSSDFVYAYRLRRIVAFLRSQKVRSKEHVYGARVYSYGDGEYAAAQTSMEAPRDEEEEVELGDIFLAEDDFGSDGYVPPDDVPLASVEDDENGIKCQVILL